MAPGEYLADAVERSVLAEHVGLSGAALERVRLADGRVLVVKRMSQETDLTLALTGRRIAPELDLWRSGVLDTLPAGLGHAVVDGWVEDDTDPPVSVLVMRDLGDCVLTWDDRLDHARCAWLAVRLARMHAAYLGAPPDGLVPPARMLSVFSPGRIEPFANAGNELAGLVLRGWEHFPERVPAEVSGPVLGLLADPAPLAAALASCPATLAHGDLATVNAAIDGDTLVLLDWGMPVAAPGALDVARFLAGCASVIEPTREEFLDLYRRAAGAAYDERALHLALLSALVWLGWNKSLDVAEHPDPEIRARETADLAWWVDRARPGLDLL